METKQRRTLRSFANIPHVRQSTPWDCGLACAEMVLRNLIKPPPSKEELVQRCGVQSIWTIDLAYLLHGYGVSIELFTTSFGVRPEYAAQEFYQDTFSEDERRVNDLFARAIEVNIKIHLRTLSQEDIISLVNHNCALIVLVNAFQLRCADCQVNDSLINLYLLSPISQVLSNLSTSNTFYGHFIVIVGYDLEQRCFYYLNPAVSHDCCKVSFELFDVARSSDGTDNDVLVVAYSRY